jgi:hypothetical protein
MALYTAAFAAGAGFMWWRVYVSARDQVVTLRGAKYPRSDEPIAFWLSVSVMAFGALLVSLITMTFLYGLFASSTG